MKIEKMTEAKLKKLDGKHIKFKMKIGSMYSLKFAGREGTIRVDSETWNLTRNGTIVPYTHYGFWLEPKDESDKMPWISASELKLMFDIEVEEE